VQNEAFIASANELYRRLTEEIARRRKEYGWTQQELAKRAGVGRAQVRLFEQGKRRLSVVNLIKLANALGCRLRMEIQD